MLVATGLTVEETLSSGVYCIPHEPTSVAVSSGRHAFLDWPLSNFNQHPPQERGRWEGFVERDSQGALPSPWPVLKVTYVKHIY